MKPIVFFRYPGDTGDTATATAPPTTDSTGTQTQPPISSDGTTAPPADDPATVPVQTNTGQTTDSTTTDDSSNTAAPDPDYVNDVLTGAVGLSKVSEAVAIVADAAFALDAIEPIGAVVEVAHMILAVWDALETPDRTCAYQGLVYGLMYTALDMGDPQPNPTWPDLSDAPLHDEKFAEGVAAAKERLADGQDGVKRKNLILLDVAKRDEKTVINGLWQAAISDDDKLLKMFTIEWPNVGPNG